MHTPLQSNDFGMPAALLEILRVSDGIEEVISIGDREESIGWILYSYEMIKNKEKMRLCEKNETFGN